MVEISCRYKAVKQMWQADMIIIIIIHLGAIG